MVPLIADTRISPASNAPLQQHGFHNHPVATALHEVAGRVHAIVDDDAVRDREGVGLWNLQAVNVARSGGDYAQTARTDMGGYRSALGYSD